MIFIGIDIETGGPILTVHPLVSIGVAVVDSCGNTLEKKRFPVPFDRKDFDKKCMIEFWQNETSNPGITKMLDMFEEEGKQVGSMKKAIRNFYNWFQKQFELYPNAQLISDYSELDIGWLNYMVGKHLKKPNLGFVGMDDNVKFWNISRSVGSFYHGILGSSGTKYETSRWSGKEAAMKKLNISIPEGRIIYDHLPENDAETTAVTYALTHKKHFSLSE